MKNLFKLLGLMITVFSMSIACSSDDSATSSDDVDGSDDDVVTELHAAFDEFDSDAVTVMLSDNGTEIYIETTGFPNHTSIYWEPDHALFIEEPTVTKTTPDTYIGGGTGEASSFTVDATPDLTGSTVATQLNTIGIAVSGAAIFNDQEGAGDLDQAAGSLDYNGAHKGPGVYHYHLEPRSISNDDDNLVGILLDGVFLYGRRDYPSNDYPTDLDASGGHFGPTPHNPDGEYHYHIINEEYNAPLYGYDEAIVLFAGPFQGY
ncbi:YHYH protein [uncultured Winogradskyella sp.]|uniref:YHYH protein n=1 Tax=Winogradskyella sp. 4-2091 TaxID=3381659 RepID=UPI00263A307B|nr:YHYH protein [uncultured Winogradskyella sp.]